MSDNKNKKNGKVDCSNCDSNVYPRMVMRDGKPDRSFCPLCGEVVKDFVGSRWRSFRNILDLF